MQDQYWEKDEALPPYQRVPFIRPLQKKLHQIADDLRLQGWTVVGNFLEDSLCQAMVQELLRLQSQRILRPARVGKEGQDERRAEIRGDLIHWLDPQQLSSPLRLAWDALEDLRLGLNRQLFLGSRRFEAHLAIYPRGSFYKKHVDQFQGQTSRILSFALYLNSPWSEDEGGQLRIYSPDDREKVVGDVLPVMGTLACFLSDSVYHEVLPPKRERYSLTGWMRNDHLS